MPFLDHPLKSFIDATKTYYSLYIDGLPTVEEDLANQKVGLDDLWVKAIAAGYEVYKDAGDNNGNDLNNGIILGQEYFLTVIDNNAPTVVTNLSITGGQTNPTLTWNASTDAASVNTSIAIYKIYRSINGGAYTLLSDTIYQERHTDTTVQNGFLYSYYVTAEDRSFNESTQSNAVSLSTLSIASEELKKIIHIYPNPVNDILSISYQGNINTVQIFDLTGKEVLQIKNPTMTIDISQLKSSIYILKIITDNGVSTKKLIKK